MIPVTRPALNDSDARAVANAVMVTFVAGGPAGEIFESKVAEYCGREFGVGVTSGTAALVLAVRALGLPPGSKVLLPAFTIVSSLYAVVENGHVPVIIDVDPLTWNADLESVQRAVQGGVDAAILVQTYASAPPMLEIVEYLADANIPVIEDAAEGLGGAQSGRRFGSFGELSILSFYANKLITTGEGGMVLTDDPVYAERVRASRNLFFDSDRRFIHSEFGGNFRLSNLQATLGISQMDRVDEFYAHRRMLYKRYLELLAGLDGHIQFQRVPSGFSSSYWVFPILLTEAAGFNAIEFIAELRQREIESRHFFYPLDRQPALEGKIDPHSETSCRLWQRGLYLPLGNGTTEEEVEISAATVRQILDAD